VAAGEVDEAASWKQTNEQRAAAKSRIVSTPHLTGGHDGLSLRSFDRSRLRSRSRAELRGAHTIRVRHRHLPLGLTRATAAHLTDSSVN
jgi:hypothetical protein